YRPVTVGETPPGYSLKSVFVMNMPCCTCLQANFTRKTGGLLAVCEHDGEQSQWFGDRPAIMATCHGHPSRLVQVDSFLAVSCPCGPRYLTIVGARDLEEVNRLVEFWSTRPTD